MASDQKRKKTDGVFDNFTYDEFNMALKELIGSPDSSEDTPDYKDLLQFLDSPNIAFYSEEEEEEEEAAIASTVAYHNQKFKTDFELKLRSVFPRLKELANEKNSINDLCMAFLVIYAANRYSRYEELKVQTIGQETNFLSFQLGNATRYLLQNLIAQELNPAMPDQEGGWSPAGTAFAILGVAVTAACAIVPR